MLIFIQELGLQLFLWMLQLIDGLMDIFSAIAGITDVNYHGQQVNMLEFLAGDSTVSAIFWCIFILAVGLTCIFTIVGLVKNMIANNRNVSTIVGKFFLALLGTLAMLAVVFLGILIANSLLQLLAKIFQVQNTAKLSNAIFNACVGNWINGYSISGVNITSHSVGEIFGGYNAALFGIWPTSWKCNGMVNPNTFMYLPALIAGVALLIALIIATLNLAIEHYYVETISEATCTHGGQIEYSCVQCGDSYMTVSEELGHYYVASTVAPTCTDGGYTTYTCTRCGDSYTDNYTPKLGHNLVSSVVAPKCTESGYTLYSCSRCDYEYRSGNTPATGHNYKQTTYPATCTEGSYTLHECSRCGDSYKDRGLDWTIANLPEYLHGVDRQADELYEVMYNKLSNSEQYKRTGNFMEDYRRLTEMQKVIEEEILNEIVYVD